MLDLVRAPHHHDLLAYFIGVDVMDHSLSVKVSKLNWESLECVSLWYMVLD